MEGFPFLKKKKKKEARGDFYFFTFNPVWNMGILKFLKIIRKRERQAVDREGGREREEKGG